MRFASPFRRRPSRRPVEAETVVQGWPAVEEEVAAPPPPPPPRARPPLLWPWLLLLLVLVAGGLIAWWLLSRGRRRSWRYHELFGWCGHRPQRHRAASARSGGARRSERSRGPGREKAERGCSARARLRRGAEGRVPGRPRTVVTLTVSAPASVTVPAVVGQRVAEATPAMRARGLSVRYSGVLSNKARGTVLGQRPAAGAKVARGATVVLGSRAGRAPSRLLSARSGARRSQRSRPRDSTRRPSRCRRRSRAGP